MASPRLYFITIEDCIKSALTDLHETNSVLHERAMSWALRGVNELKFSVLKDLKRVFLEVDSATKSALLPNDFVQYTKVGLRTDSNEFVPLAFNPSIIINPTIPVCHCDECGCTDEVCYALGESNLTTTTETVTINGNDYDKTITICTKENGDIIKKTCQPTVNNPKKLCDYQIVFENQEGNPLIPLNMAWSDFKFYRNGIEYYVGDVPDKATLIAIMTANGFTEDGLTLEWNIEQTNNQWTSATYYDSNHLFTTATFVATSCTTPTPEIETVCYEEFICHAEVEECGCVTLTDTQIDMIANCCSFFCAATERQRKNKDFGQSLAQPKGYFGEFNLNAYEGVIQLNLEYQYDTVFLEYYTCNNVDSKDYQIPAQAEEALVAYIKFRYKFNKSNVSMGEKVMAQKDWLNQKRLLKQLLNPIRMAEILESMRVFPRP